MADLLTQHLKNKSESHSALQSLYSQWDFDRKLIPKALQTVGNLFPHYSRHDESHSRQILVNIERLLGDNLALLTATDTWLLLEAAYWHDIGMVVPQRDFENALSDPEFDGFLQGFTSQPHHELHTIATTLKSKSGSFSVFFDGAPLDAVTRFRELMAEWFRRKHPVRAEQIVNAPHYSAGISSPRTELIPARLFSVLGRICSMHGASFDTLIGAGGLSFREAGMARDDCHPRFVACLLRLGDLLDLDDNRFCPVMQGIAGQDRPALSKAHEDKHAAIQHLRIDQERISIEAECQTVDGYIEAFRWFGWLKEEMQAQMSQWRDIVPSRELGLLPTLGPASVRLAGNLKILKNGERPAFTLDTQKAIELLQGNNLYESEYACIRELLQNSVDATLLKIWMTQRTNLEDGSWKSPDNEMVRQLFANAPIHVTLTESAGSSTNAGETSCWTLIIRDSGTGISLDDLQYMLRIGGSQRNTARRREIDDMPEWMKPSGIFGIGFQSIFMLCDQVSLTTKSFVSNDILEITMYSPTGPREGLVLVSQLSHDVSVPVGTTIKISFEREKFAKSWSVPYRNDGSISFELVKSLDPVLDDCFPFTVAKLADQVRNFGKDSIIPIEGRLQTLSNAYPLHQEKNDQSADNDISPWRFVRANDTDVRIRYWPKIERHSLGMVKTLYRGQPFEAKNFSVPNVVVEIDLMSGPAGAWINFSRDKVAASGKDKLKATVLESLEVVVREDIAASKNGNPPWSFQREQLPQTSFFLKSMALEYEGSWIDHSKYLNDAWLDIACNPEGGSLREFFNRDEWIIGLLGPNNERPEGKYDVAIADSSTFKLAIAASEWLNRTDGSLQIIGAPEILRTDVGALQSHVQDPVVKIQSKSRLRSLRYLFSSAKVPLYDTAAFATALVQMMGNSLGNERVISFMEERFSGLSLIKGTRLFARHLFPLAVPNNTFVLLPFLFRGEKNETGVSIEASPEQLDRLCRWVQPHLQRTASLEEIRQQYDELIHWIDHEVMKVTVFSEKWFQARGLSQQ